MSRKPVVNLFLWPPSHLIFNIHINSHVLSATLVTVHFTVFKNNSWTIYWETFEWDAAVSLSQSASECDFSFYFPCCSLTEFNRAAGEQHVLLWAGKQVKRTLSHAFSLCWCQFKFHEKPNSCLSFTQSPLETWEYCSAANQRGYNNMKNVFLKGICPTTLLMKHLVWRSWLVMAEPLVYKQGVSVRAVKAHWPRWCCLIWEETWQVNYKSKG